VAARMSWRAAVVAGILGVVCAGVFWFLSMLGFAGWLVSLHWLRALRLVPPFVVIAVVLWLGGRTAGLVVPGWRVLLVVLMTLVPTMLTILGLEYVYLRRHYPLKHVALEADRTTPQDALILTEPVGGCAFRTWSKRAVLWTKADKNFVSSAERGVLKQYVSRVGKAYRKSRRHVLMECAREGGADYVVLPVDTNPASHEHHWELIPKYELRTVTPAESPSAPTPEADSEPDAAEPEHPNATRTRSREH